MGSSRTQIFALPDPSPDVYVSDWTIVYLSNLDYPGIKAK